MDFDPNPDYDASDELEYFFSWLPWALRGVDWTGTPAYPPVLAGSGQPGERIGALSDRRRHPVQIGDQ